MAIRLDKYLAELGIGTRSEVKKLIKAKQITVNGVTAEKPEMKLEESADEVCLRGEKLCYRAFEYYLFHKPAGCVTATEDSRHKTVMDYLTDTKRNDLFPVGRLDIDTEGLLLITNDGALAHALLSPTKHVPKTYYAKVLGKVTAEDVSLFKNGLDIGEEKLTKPGSLVIRSNDSFAANEPALAERELAADAVVSEIELTITEGKFHQVKRMFQAVGKEVIYLKRISMGSLTLPKDLKAGEYRALTDAELINLQKGAPANTNNR